jgi:hypothetical protein
MTLHMSNDERTGCIEWEVEYENGDYDYEEIGLWFDEHTMPNRLRWRIRHAQTSH